MGDQEDYVLNAETVKMLKRRRNKCFLCRMVLADFEKNGRLTDSPSYPDGTSVFPISGKVNHVQREKEAALSGVSAADLEV